VQFLTLRMSFILLLLYVICYKIKICPCYIDLWKKYIKKCYFTRHSMVSFFELLMIENKIILSNLSRFVKEAMLVRTNVLSAN